MRMRTTLVAGLSTASRQFRVLHRLNVILSLRRIRDPSARRDEVRILRLCSQARFAQDDSAPCDRVRDLRFGSYTLSIILSLRRIRDPSARRDEVRILRLRSQARFAQDDSALPSPRWQMSADMQPGYPWRSMVRLAGGELVRAGARPGMRLATLGLVACGIALVWSHVAVAALAVCLNETPALAADLRQAAPPIDAVARGLLPLFTPLGVGLGGAAPSCDAAAPARAMAVAGLAYVAALVVLARSAVPVKLTWIVVGVATGVIQLSLLCMPGLLSSDVLDYASHGRVAAVHAANPYVMTPADFPADPFARLGGWPDVVTVYGPLWTRLEVAITGALADGRSVNLYLAFKLLALASELISAGLIFWIVRRWRGIGATDATPVAAVAMWVWNPLVNLETIGSAHNEAVMIVFVLLALALLSEAVRPRQRALAEKFLWTIALVCLWLGALVKFVPAGIEAIVGLVCLRRATSPSRAFGLAVP